MKGRRRTDARPGHRASGAAEPRSPREVSGDPAGAGRRADGEPAANPIFYADSQLVPYGTNSVRKPDGPTQYDLNVSHPLDYSHKRRARMAYASRALQVMEAQYQNEVRLAIANLYAAFVDVLTARDGHSRT